VDPMARARPTAYGLPNAIATVALAPRGSRFNPGHVFYMGKIAVGPEARHVIDIEAPVEDNLRKIDKAKGGNVEDLTAVILDRPRHEELIRRVRRVGTRILLIPDGDVAGALMTSLPETGIDVLLGICGTPEGVLAACALRCTGGTIPGTLHPRNDEEKRKGEESGYELNRGRTIDNLVSSEHVFFAATGITNGELLRGVDYYPGGATTDSIVLRGLTGTSRRIISTHRLTKLSKISAIHY